jgi:hypothetical protein
VTPQDFARCLACWMSPGMLARAAGEWRDESSRSHIADLRFESTILTNAASGRLDWLVRQFLDHVVIPEELIRFTHGLYASHVTEQAADWLRSFAFTGELRLDPADPPRAPDGKVVIAISSRVCELHVIRSPLEMLVTLISDKVDYWTRAASVTSPQQVHREPVGEWPFEPWIDLHVARSCGFENLGRSGVVPTIPLVSNVRGHVSVSGVLPKDETELAAFAVVASLHPREKSRGFDLYQAIRKKP